ncbi:MAG TPA: hypothetical protein VFI61_04315 [Patescibacteria group bacterium]|nr:hypothetical protein [Patescibacteria group bacterium]
MAEKISKVKVADGNSTKRYQATTGILVELDDQNETQSPKPLVVPAQSKLGQMPGSVHLKEDKPIKVYGQNDD